MKGIPEYIIGNSKRKKYSEKVKLIDGPVNVFWNGIQIGKADEGAYQAVEYKRVPGFRNLWRRVKQTS